MKELRKKVMLLFGERLLEFGFKRKVLNTFVRQLDDNRIQNIGFTIANCGQKYSFYLNPVIGVAYKNVNRLDAQLNNALPFKYPEYVYATISTPLGYLMPENTFKEWKFSNQEDVEKEVNSMADAIIGYGLPYLNEFSDEDNLVYGLECDKFHIGEVKYDLLPIFYYLRGNNERALQCIENAIKMLGQVHSQEDYEILERLAADNGELYALDNKSLNAYMIFVENFKRMIEMKSYKGGALQ